MIAHTPAPWESRVSNGNRRIWEIIGPRREAICSTHIWFDEHRGECLANVHLMTAAPGLLSALKEARDALLGVVDIVEAGRAPNPGEIHDALTTANAAIAKAEGGGA